VGDPLYFISRVLQPAERKWHIREKEALAIIYACETCRAYVIGYRFLVETDHKSLQWLLDAKSPPRLVRWALRLSEYDFEIRHKKGVLNTNADALSRLIQTPTTAPDLHEDYEEQLYFIGSMDPEQKRRDFVLNQRLDPLYQSILEECDLNHGYSISGNYKLQEGLLYRIVPGGNKQLMVPHNMVEQILTEHHNNDHLIHLSRDRLYSLLKSRYYWPRMYTNVKDWVASCLQCNKIKPGLTNHGLLQPIVIQRPFETIGMDLMGPLPTTARNNRYILVCVDLFTNWVESCALKTITAATVIQAFFELIFSRHGCPTQVLTDQGTQFTAEVFKDLLKTYGIKHLKSSAYHHQTNGKTERFNRFLTSMLALKIDGKITSWDKVLSHCLMVHRITVSRTLDDSPFFFLYGRDPIIPNDLKFPVKQRKLNENPDLDVYKMEQLKILKSAYEKLLNRRDNEQNSYKKHYDRTHKDVVFQKGDSVMLYWLAHRTGVGIKHLPK
jgi:putative transposase